MVNIKNRELLNIVIVFFFFPFSLHYTYTTNIVREEKGVLYVKEQIINFPINNMTI